MRVDRTNARSDCWGALTLALVVPAWACATTRGSHPGWTPAYPSKQLPARYEEFGGGLGLPQLTGKPLTIEGIRSAATVAFEGKLPRGVRLRRLLPAAVGADRQAPGSDSGSPEARPKHMVLYELEYEGILLAKGTDALAIVGPDARI